VRSARALILPARTGQKVPTHDLREEGGRRDMCMCNHYIIYIWIRMRIITMRVKYQMTKKEIKSCGKREGVADGRTGCSFLFHLLCGVCVSPSLSPLCVAVAATKVKTPFIRSCMHPFLIMMLIWFEISIKFFCQRSH
jgi:hypothetical protein